MWHVFLILAVTASMDTYTCRLKQNKQPEEEVLAQQEDVSDEEEVLHCCPVSYACHFFCRALHQCGSLASC